MTTAYPWLVIYHGNVVTIEYVEQVRANVATAPPATREQLDLLRVLLRPREPGTTSTERRGRHDHS